MVAANEKIMNNGDPPSIKMEKRKRMVKIDRVNFLGSEVWGLADVGEEKLGGWLL